MAKKAILDETPVRKNIDLPKWVIDEFDLMAEDHRNKFKPYVELILINVAKQHKEARVRAETKNIHSSY